VRVVALKVGGDDPKKIIREENGGGLNSVFVHKF